MDYSPASSFVHGISQAGMLEWVAISFSRGYSPLRDWTCVSCIGRQILYCLATRVVHCKRATVLYSSWVRKMNSFRWSEYSLIFLENDRIKLCYPGRSHLSNLRRNVPLESLFNHALHWLRSIFNQCSYIYFWGTTDKHPVWQMWYYSSKNTKGLPKQI